MLFLITGTPGAGKSQLWVSYLFSFLSPSERIIEVDGVKRPRDVFENGVTGLDHDQFQVQRLENPELWYDCPVGSAIVIDEAQRVFPQRMAGREVPKKCSEFETHRHKGYDIWLLTQDANLLDVHVRRLVNIHIHVDRLFGLPLAKVYTYPRYMENAADPWVKKENAVSRKWFFYRRKFYKAYKSSEVHTARKKIPLPVYILPLLLIYIAWAGYDFYQGLGEEPVAEDVSGGDLLPPVFSAALSSPASTAGLPTRERKAAYRAEYVYQTTPSVDGFPWTAPQYEKVVSAVVTFPRPLCIITNYQTIREKCSCLSQQGTRLTVPDDACTSYAVDGFFDPTIPDEGQGLGVRGAHAAPDAARAAVSRSAGSVAGESYRVPGITRLDPANLYDRAAVDSKF